MESSDLRTFIMYVTEIEKLGKWRKDRMYVTEIESSGNWREDRKRVHFYVDLQSGPKLTQGRVCKTQLKKQVLQ